MDAEYTGCLTDVALGLTHDRQHVLALHRSECRRVSSVVAAQIPVGGGDHSDVHRDALVPSHPCELPILEEAQQFGLHLERQLSHLVEQERAAVCYFQPSQPPFLRPGEGSPLMAEHFTLEERD